MSFFLLDPMSGGLSGMLYRFDGDGEPAGEISVGYSAEARYQPHTNELVVLESEAGGPEMKYSLRILDAARLEEKLCCEIPVRPMYAGYPGRSVAGSVSPSGRFVYFLHIGAAILCGDDPTFRMVPARLDRKSGQVQLGAFHVDSCKVDYGVAGDGEEGLFLHLSCECASTIALGSFSSPDCGFLRMETLPAREHSPQETNGSWLDSSRALLYCVNRQGTIYEADLRQRTARVLARLRLPRGYAVPVHQIWGAGGQIHVGVAEDRGNMGLGMVTEIWSVGAETGAFVERRRLPRPIMNFIVTPDNRRLLGVDPYSRTIFCQDRATGEEVWSRRHGATPAEIIPGP